MNYARLIATGTYLPNQVITNDDLADKVDTSDAWIQKRTGIKQRHIAQSEEDTVSMGCHAAQQALARGGVTASDVDAVLVASCTAKNPFPSAACQIAEALGVGDCYAMDLNAACSGTLFALELVHQQMYAPHGWNTVLIIGTETMTRVVNWSDRSSCVLFGDGAGVMLLQKDIKPGVENVVCQSGGQGVKALYTRNQAREDTHKPVFEWDVAAAETVMHGQDVFKAAVEKLSQISSIALKQLGYTIDDVDWCVPHQANARILHAVCKHIGLPKDKMINTIDRHANTSAASIPLALDTALMEGTIKPGQRVLLNAFGAGYTWGAAIVTA